MKSASKLEQLGDLVEINPPCSSMASKDAMVSFIGMTDLSEAGRIQNQELRPFRDVEKGYTQFAEGDVIVAKITPCFENGKGALASGLSNGRGAGSTEFHVLRPSARVDSKYIHCITQSTRFRLLGEAHMEGSAGHRRVPDSFLKTYCIPVPPLIEQRKIAEILGTWDTALEKLDALIAAKERRKQALISALISGPRGPRGVKGWSDTTLSQVLGRVFRPVVTAANDNLALVSIRRRCGGLFRRPDVLASEYKTQDLHALKSGDFLISKRQVVHGAWALVESEFDGTLVSKEYAIMVNQAPKYLDMRYFAWLAQTPRMLRLARVASTGVHIEKLIFDPDVFLREKIWLPAISEQRKIADLLDSADAELQLLRQQRTALDQQKRGLMQQLLTGKVRVAAKESGSC